MKLTLNLGNNQPALVFEASPEAFRAALMDAARGDKEFWEKVLLPAAGTIFREKSAEYIKKHPEVLKRKGKKQA